MDLISWVMIGILGGAFLFGIWFMLVRDDDRTSRTMTIPRQNLTRRGAPDFSKAHNEFDRKLAEVERHLNAKRRDERAIALAEEEVRKKLAEEAAAKLMAEEQAKIAEMEAEEARKKAEYEAAREAELEEARRLAAEREAERQEENLDKENSGVYLVSALSHNNVFLNSSTCTTKIELIRDIYGMKDSASNVK